MRKFAEIKGDYLMEKILTDRGVPDLNEKA